MENIRNRKESEFSLDEANVLTYGNHLCVPYVGNLRRTLLEEAYSSSYTVHPSSTKMYQDLNHLFW